MRPEVAAGSRGSRSRSFGGVFLNNRGLVLPSPMFRDGAWLVGSALLVGIAGQRRLPALGAPPPGADRRAGSRSLWVVARPDPRPAARSVYLALGRPIGFDVCRVLKGFNFVGGRQVFPEFAALLLGLSIYTGAFIAEIVRAGIQRSAAGPAEAAEALGLRPDARMRLVVMPQAMRVIIPPLTNQYLNLIKNSSLAVFIGYPDLVQVFAGTVLNQTGAPCSAWPSPWRSICDLARHLVRHEPLQQAHRAGGEVRPMTDADLCRAQRTCAARPSSAPSRRRPWPSGPLAWVRSNLFSALVSTRPDARRRSPSWLWVMPGLVALPAHRRGLAAPTAARPAARFGRGLLALHRRQVRLFPLSAPYPVDQRWRVDAHRNRRRRADRLAAVANARPKRNIAALLFFVAYPVSGLHPAARLGLARPAGRRHEPVGRRPRHAADVAGRHRLLAAARRAAGARAPLARCRSSAPAATASSNSCAACRSSPSVHGELHAAAVPAGGPGRRTGCCGR